MNSKDLQDHNIEECLYAESSAHILRGLISYHERMTMGNYPERDFYLDGLRFALTCVEEKIKREYGAE